MSDQFWNCAAVVGVTLINMVGAVILAWIRTKNTVQVPKDVVTQNGNGSGIIVPLPPKKPDIPPPF